MIDVREFFYNACHFTVGSPLRHSYILPSQKLTQCKVQKTSDGLGPRHILLIVAGHIYERLLSGKICIKYFLSSYIFFSRVSE